MTAAALLRRLDAEATGGPWRSSVYLNAVLDANENPIAYVGNADTRHAVTITRNLLPLLAGLVEAVGRHEALMGMARRPGKQATMEAIMEARGGISAAYAALEAAAKEGV